MRLHHGLIVLFGCLLFACGSDGPGTGPVDPDDAMAGCMADCQHRASCGSTTPVAECTTECVNETGWVRADTFADLIDCFGSQACGASQDTCIAMCEPTSAHERYESTCRANLATCGTPDDVNQFCETQPTGAGDVGFFCLATPAIMDEMTACIPAGVDCKTALACLQGVLEAHGIDA